MKTLALINGNIYLERERFAEALYAEDGIIAAVGTTEEILALAGEDCKIIDADGKTVIPGINDAHCHFLLMGIGLTRAETAGSTSIDDLVARCRAFRETHPELCEHGILSLGFNEDLFTEGEKRLPDRYDLDRIATDIPATDKELQRASSLRFIVAEISYVSGAVYVDYDASLAPYDGDYYLAAQWN